MATKQVRKDYHMKLYKNPPEVYLALGEAADRKANMVWHRIFVLAIMAGIFVGIGGAVSVTVAGGVTAHFTNGNFTNSPTLVDYVPILPKILLGLTFPIGLILVLLMGAELFTGNTMVMTLGAMGGKNTVPQMLLSWGLSWSGNYVGCVLIALVMWGAGTYQKEPWFSYLEHLAQAKVNDNWAVLLLKGIPCNILVCAAVVMAYASEDIVSKVAVSYSAIFTFVACGFEHSIANMYFVTVAAFYGADVDYGVFIYNNLIPVTIGNIIGAAIVLAAPYYYVYYMISAPTKVIPTNKISRREDVSTKQDHVNEVKSRKDGMLEDDHSFPLKAADHVRHSPLQQRRSKPGRSQKERNDGAKQAKAENSNEDQTVVDLANSSKKPTPESSDEPTKKD